MYRSVDSGTWDDPWFSDLEPCDKLLFLYMVTNRRQTPCGAIEITLKAMSFETGIPVGQVEEALGRLSPKIVWWAEHKTVWVRNFFKHQHAKSNKDNFLKGARSSVYELCREVRDAIIAEYPELGDPSCTDREPIPIPSPSHGEGIPLKRQDRTVNETGQLTGQDRGLTPPAHAPAPAHARTELSKTKPVPKPEPATRPKRNGQAAGGRPPPSLIAISPAMRQWAAREVPKVADLEAATEEWLDWCRHEGEISQDWEAAWRQGMRRAQRFITDREGKGNGRSISKNGSAADSAADYLDWVHGAAADLAAGSDRLGLPGAAPAPAKRGQSP